MTEEKFDQYPFRYYTEIKWMGEWHTISEIWFPERKIGIPGGYLLNYSEIEGIRF